MNKLIFCLLLLAPHGFLVAQDASKPAAQNAWEEIYVRIAESYSPESLLELLKSMELESDQEGLASSYAIILKDHIYHYITRKTKDSGYTDMILSFLLGQVAQLAEPMKQKNPEVANVIAITLIPELGYNAEMGEANLAIGKLGAVEFAPGIIQRLEDINSIMLDGGHLDWTGLNYSAMGCLLALQEFALPSSLPVLYQIIYGPFNEMVRKQAKSVLTQLLKSQEAEMQAQFIDFVTNTENLMYLELLAHDMEIDALDLGEKALAEINLALLTRMNNVTWRPIIYSENIKHEVMRKTIGNLLANGAGELAKENTKALKNSYEDSNNFSLKLQVLQAIGQLATEDGLAFLRSEVLRLNFLQRSDSIGFADERLLYQLIYSLRISKDASPETISALRDIMISPYSGQIRDFAKELISDLS